LAERRPGVFNALGETVRSAALASPHGALSDRFPAATKLYLIKLAFGATSRSNREGVARRLPIAICVAPMLDHSWILKPPTDLLAGPRSTPRNRLRFKRRRMAHCVLSRRPTSPNDRSTRSRPDLFFVRRALIPRRTNDEIIVAVDAPVRRSKCPADSNKTVVLVHGAFADGSSWDKVIPLLQAKGLRVVAVQNPLTSLADDVAATKRVLGRAEGARRLGRSLVGRYRDN